MYVHGINLKRVYSLFKVFEPKHIQPYLAFKDALDPLMLA